MTYDDIIAACPPMACAPGCGDCCGLIPFSPREWARVAARAPAGLTLHRVNGSYVPQHGDSLDCPFFDGSGCAVYADRPFICRLYGTAPIVRALACPHRRQPDIPLSRHRADWLTMRYLRVERVSPPCA